MAGKRRDPAERFWEKVDKSAPRGCWDWTASLNDGGYGMFAKGGRPTVWAMAHRVSYEMHFGAIPAGMYVCHVCDNRRCVNPAHLFLGTPEENVRDKNRKGRGNYSRHNAKLSDTQVAEILTLQKMGVSNREIAARFGVSRFVPYAIAKGRTYRHLQAN